MYQSIPKPLIPPSLPHPRAIPGCLSGQFQELENKGKVQLGDRKSGRGRDRLRELFITKWQFKWGFARVVVTRAGPYSRGPWERGSTNPLMVHYKVSYIKYLPALLRRKKARISRV